MIIRKWERIGKEIQQLIDDKSFEKAIQLLKQSAIEKKNIQLQQDIALVTQQFNDFIKNKQLGFLSAEEIQNEEMRFAYALNYFIHCLQSGGAAASAIGSEPSAGEPPEIEITPSKSEKAPTINIERPLPVFEIESSPASTPPKKSEAPKKSRAKPAKNSAKPMQTEGGILYNIPNEMQLGTQTKCIVRLAFDKKLLKKTTDKFTDEVIQTVRVSEVMEVDLIDLSGEDAFNIQFVSQKEQFIDKNEATEWLIMVKPLKAGSYSLALKVAIIEKIDGKERRKEMILEEVIAVVGVPIVTSVAFKSPDQPFQVVSVQTLLPTDTPSVKTVLFMGANPPGTQFLQLEVEHSRISVELEGKYRFPTAKFLSASEIPKLFIIHKPNVVHFSGHGKDPSVKDGENGARGIGFPKNYDKTGGIIVFDNDMRGMKVIEDKALDIVFANAVQKLKIPIEVVVFNSCHSESQAKVVSKSVPYVVGTAHAIKDETAIAFAVGFYFGLASGLSVEDAFISGKTTAVIEDLSAENLIVLYKNGEKLNS